MTLHALEFIRRFLQHILPKGFQKVRYYGFLHPKRKRLFNQMRVVLKVKFKFYRNQYFQQKGGYFITVNSMLCPDCGRPMVCIDRKTIGRPPPLNELFGKTAA